MFQDELGVLETTGYVVERARFVEIDQSVVSELAARLAGGDLAVPVWDVEHHFYDGTALTANYILVLDALNFSFWGEPRWQIHYNGELLDGYRALAAALKRAVEEGVPLLDAAYLAQIKPAELAHVLRGHGEIPLFDERLANLREAGRVLTANYDGLFSNAIETAGHSAIRLAALIVREFTSFDDVASYDAREVRFYKRAQICVGDLYGVFRGERWGRFQDLTKLTAFADYKIPQILRQLGVLKYDAALSERVDAKQQLAAGSTEEVEIRAATIWGVEYLRRALANRGRQMRGFELDWYLWNLSQEESSATQPYHRTRTIYY